MINRFSKRVAHSIKKPIEIREDAPQGLREFIIQLIYELSYQPSSLRGVIC